MKEKIKKELEDFFSNNLVNSTTVTDFYLEDGFFGSLDIIPVEPYFDEDYHDDDADKEIEKIGNKYNVELSWVYWVYPK